MDLQLPPVMPQSLVESIIPTNFVAYFQALKKMESQSSYLRLGNDKPLCKWRT
uniref:Uncharacterized protein n=1 Tax=Romanomermis culicivorax TaxID=13658 RepID=A0A915IN05_ROMCU